VEGIGAAGKSQKKTWETGTAERRKDNTHGRRLMHKRRGKTRKSWGTRTVEMRNKGKERKPKHKGEGRFSTEETKKKRRGDRSIREKAASAHGRQKRKDEETEAASAQRRYKRKYDETGALGRREEARSSEMKNKGKEEKALGGREEARSAEMKSKGKEEKAGETGV
jgi:hypothetical protein